MDTAVDRPSYPPVQQHVIEALGRRGDDTAVPTSYIQRLRDDLEARLAEPAAAVPATQELWIGKSALHLLEGCEAHWQAAARTPFAWSVPAAVGTVAHKAIELARNWRGPTEPARLTDEAIARILEGDTSLSDFARSLSTVQLAELRCEVVALVTSFEECFPPLRPQWRPVIEGAIRVPLLDGRVTLSGRPDLTLGRATGGGKVIIDLKTGRRAHHHGPELEFYALLDALKLGVAPRRVATVHLDSGRPVVAAVTEDVLTRAADRVVRAVETIAEIRTRRRPATVRAGPACAFCPLRSSCETGAAWLAARDAGDLEESFWWAP